ncbi:MAG: zinc ABC transporter substrate-binding protein [Clostridia bacterium]|nr:zinc ABC transporter substrate-binding protein [Clostridia bacterium]
MKRILKAASAAIMLSLVLVSCVNEPGTNRIIIAVGIVPQAAFVERVAGDLVDVVTLIPPGNSPANYNPSSNEMRMLSDATVYFTLQMPTEEANILPKASDFNKNLLIVNLRDEVSKIYPLLMAAGHDHGDENEETVSNDSDGLTIDPHLWLSPRRAVVMVSAIANTLSTIDPYNRSIYMENASAFILEIEALESEIKNILEPMESRSFMIYHGSYGYFADDFGLEMISIEVAGKKATASEMQEVIKHAREEGISIVFYQDEFDDNQARTIAEEINGRVVKASPLSQDYIQSLRDFANALGGGEGGGQ